MLSLFQWHLWIYKTNFLINFKIFLFLLFKILVDAFIKLTTITLEFKNFLKDLIVRIMNFKHQTFKLLDCIYGWFFFKVFLELFRQNNPKFDSFKFFYFWFKIKLECFSLCNFSVNKFKKLRVKEFVFEDAWNRIVSGLKILNPLMVFFTEIFKFFVCILKLHILNEFPHFIELIWCYSVIIIPHEYRLILTLEKQVISCSYRFNEIIKECLIFKRESNSLFSNGC